MHCEGKLKWMSHNTSYCLLEVVTKAGLTVSMKSDMYYIQGRIMTFWGPYANEIMAPSDGPPSNALTPVLNIFYSWYILATFT
jgi:hypothetical protein